MKPTTEQVAMTETAPRTAPQPSTWFKKIVTGASPERRNNRSRLASSLAAGLLTAVLASASFAADTCENSVGMEFVRLAPGKFLMGSEHGDRDELPVREAPISKPIINEAFDAPALPTNWNAPNAKAFSIADGALRGVCSPDDHHGPAISVPITAHDLDIEFDVKMVRPGNFLFLVDGDSQFGGQAHLLRFAVAGGQAQLAQDRGSLESKLAQAKTIDPQGDKPKPTAEQLADPKFYRTESLARQPGKLSPEWQHVSLRLRGQQIEAQLGGGPTLRGTASVPDVPKTRLVFLIAQNGDMRVDNVKVFAISGTP